MEIQGKIIAILPIQGGTSATTGKSWQVETFVIETLESYPRKVAIEIFGEQRIKDNPIAIDQVVTVSFDLESREFSGRWYTSARAWKIEQGAAQTAAQQAAQPMAAAVPAAVPQAPADPQAPQQAVIYPDRVPEQPSAPAPSAPANDPIAAAQPAAPAGGGLPF